MTIHSSDGQVCAAWVNFNGKSTVSIRQSYNVSSITDNATGRYTVNFSSAVAVADYAVFVTSSYGSAEKGGSDDDDYINGLGTIRRESGNTTTTAFKMVCGYGTGGSTQDHAQICAGIFC